MFTELADTLVWILRTLILTGLCWGAWLIFSHTFLPPPSEKKAQYEHFATFALLVLLFSTLGGVLHAG